jgi:hypothetical protein
MTPSSPLSPFLPLPPWEIMPNCHEHPFNLTIPTYIYIMIKLSREIYNLIFIFFLLDNQNILNGVMDLFSLQKYYIKFWKKNHLTGHTVHEENI